ncbi:MAG: hypothetical protein DI598_11020 [Pseudopedobacter saltans]|uniref:Gylcosyl hydrolase 115 C-terminal domain-containing protein n=1 Tax=Pseudopedobacter saltans TaxID=151895 RepID=A0A2W5F0P0_9SPHI|nr:MAG: hypothetical protein DI598_11020 [Pseudopedobacter saltans]
MIAKKTIPLFLLVCGFQSVKGQLRVENKGSDSSLELSSCQILGDTTEVLAVDKTIRLFSDDVYRVTGKKPNVEHKIAATKNLIVAGTTENKWIKQLVDRKKINLHSIEGQWEKYGIFFIKNPFPSVKKAIVVVGSDRRAVAYGLFSISEKIGVSPWYWWADVPVPKRKKLFISTQDYISQSPSVKFRGLFINDEDWGIRPWAKNTYDKSLQNIGPKTYAKVFELLLRLKANYLCPAMHEASSAFNKYPENKLVADSFGIVMGSTHPEPLLFNNASEWDKKTMGEWNYMTNKNGILKVLDQRVKENAPYENVYTLALRGLHDQAMKGNYALADRVKLVHEALMDQRAILKAHINQPIEKIPQIFVPYKEVLTIYNAGLKVPDDVTIVWPDDNYGYLKQLSNKEEQKRSGHSGVYYHASYLGSPHDYLWLGSTPPNLMYEELSKAYKTGADRVWLLNAGDIKSCESPITQFLGMAYHIDSFNFDNTPYFQASWLASIYGKQYEAQLNDITTHYNSLAFARKPEFMGWGYEWNSSKNQRERPTETEFSFDNYNEAQDRIDTYDQIENQADDILKKLPEEYKASFFQLVDYPIKGASLMNKIWLTAQLQRQYVNEKRNTSNELKQKVDSLYDSLKKLTNTYNTLLNGKWDKMMSLVQGVTASYFEIPKLDSIVIPETGKLGIHTSISTISSNSLPLFNKWMDNKKGFEIYNTGKHNINWTANAKEPWIVLSAKGGTLAKQDSIYVSIDWSKITSESKASGVVELSDGKEKKLIFISAYDPGAKPDTLTNIPIEYDGVVSIPAINYQRKVESTDIKIQTINELGYKNKSVMFGNPVANPQNPKSEKAPNLAYDFYTFNRGVVNVYTYVLPTFPLSSDRDFGFHESSNSQTVYGVSIDNGAIAFPSSSAPEYSQTWSENVLRNTAINKSTLYIDKPGKHTIKIICGDPGIVLQKIVVDFGGMQFSYQGPPSTISK